jgi:protein tyrosine/serine phosphatase
MGGCAGAVGGYCAWLQFEGNIHVVHEGTLYRSAQLDGQELRRTVRMDGIRSILNLRGQNNGSAWYDDEVSLARELGVTHYDYALSARRRVALSDLKNIIDIIRKAPKPLLIHCKGGADRTGLISAAYLLLVDGASPNTAGAQLSLVYGHFPYLGSPTKAMDESFQELFRPIAEHDRPVTGASQP